MSETRRSRALIEYVMKNVQWLDGVMEICEAVERQYPQINRNTQIIEIGLWAEIVIPVSVKDNRELATRVLYIHLRLDGLRITSEPPARYTDPMYWERSLTIYCAYEAFTDCLYVSPVFDEMRENPEWSKAQVRETELRREKFRTKWITDGEELEALIERLKSYNL